MVDLYWLLRNGLKIQWGTVSNTSGAPDWLVQTLPLNYSNTNYKIFLQGRSRNAESATFVVRDIDITVQTFKYFWGQGTNNLNYLTIGY